MRRRALLLGTRWRADTDGWVTGLRAYRVPGDTGTHTGSLWAADGTLLATGVFTDDGAGWATLDTSVRITAGAEYVVSVHSASGRYGYTLGALPATRGPLTLLGGAYRYGAPGSSPTQDAGGTWYGVDVVLAP